MRNARSAEMARRAQELIVGGGQAHKRPVDLEAGTPAFIDRARGARFWDVDGNEYLDFLMSYGPIVLGHADPAVDDAVRRQMERGTVFNVEFPQEIELAEALIERIPTAEMVAFFVGGSGSTSGAVRMARAHTGRDLVIRCGYHGWHDWTQPGGTGVPQAVGALTLGVPYNDLEALEDLLKSNAGRVAAVMIEAVVDDGPASGYFEGVRTLTRDHGALFLLDEVKTGFRFALGGAQAYYGIDADLSCFGKAMCNGYPGSVVVGRREFMAPRTDVWLAATFHADALSVAAALATLNELERRQAIPRMWRLGQRLKDGLDTIFQEAGVGLRVCGQAPLANVRPASAAPPSEAVLCQRFYVEMIRAGVYMTSHPWFLCAAHTEADIDHTLDVARAALRRALA